MVHGCNDPIDHGLQFWQLHRLGDGWHLQFIGFLAIERDRKSNSYGPDDFCERIDLFLPWRQRDFDVQQFCWKCLDTGRCDDAKHRGAYFGHLHRKCNGFGLCFSEFRSDGRHSGRQFGSNHRLPGKLGYRQ